MLDRAKSSILDVSVRGPLVSTHNTVSIIVVMEECNQIAMVKQECD